jgi:hypothetical protein
MAASAFLLAGVRDPWADGIRVVTSPSTQPLPD